MPDGILNGGKATKAVAVGSMRLNLKLSNQTTLQALLNSSENVSSGLLLFTTTRLSLYTKQRKKYFYELCGLNQHHVTWYNLF